METRFNPLIRPFTISFDSFHWNIFNSTSNVIISVSSESFFFLFLFYLSSLLVIYKEIGEKKKKKDNNSVDILKLWWIQYQYCWKYLNKINSTTPKNITNGKRSGLHKSSKGVEVTCLQAAYMIHFDYYLWLFLYY